MFGLSDQVFWFENTDGAGDFSSAKGIHVLNPEEESISNWGGGYVAAADLDDDGDLDLVACSVGSGEVSWFENTDGEGTFSDANLIAIDVGMKRVCVCGGQRTDCPMALSLVPAPIQPLLHANVDARPANNRVGVIDISGMLPARRCEEALSVSRRHKVHIDGANS